MIAEVYKTIFIFCRIQPNSVALNKVAYVLDVKPEVIFRDIQRLEVEGLVYTTVKKVEHLSEELWLHITNRFLVAHADTYAQAMDLKKR